SHKPSPLAPVKDVVWRTTSVTNRPAVLVPGYRIPWLGNLGSGGRARKLRRAYGPVSYLIGVNGTQNVTEPLLACQGRVCLAGAGCQIPEGHGLTAGGNQDAGG